MAITAAQINELRKATGAGMLDCKKALEQNDGDFEKSVDYLRTKGLAAAAKKSSRAATEGMVAAFVSDDLKSGVLLEINSETDFVAKNDLFKAFVNNIGQHILATSPADRDAMLAQPYSGDPSKTVQSYLNESISVIGENIQIRRFARFPENFSVAYVHAGGKIGVLVNLEVSGDIDATVIGKDIAMQIAALNPRFWDKSQVSEDVLAEEKKILQMYMEKFGVSEATLKPVIEVIATKNDFSIFS